MCNECWTDDTEVNVNDEDIHIGWKFRSGYGLSSRAQNRSQDDDPDSDDDALDNKCQNCPVKEGVFRNPPELKMPAVGQGPEDEGRTQSGKRKGRAQTQGQTSAPEDVTQNVGKDRLTNGCPRMSPFTKGPTLGSEDRAKDKEPGNGPDEIPR